MEHAIDITKSSELTKLKSCSKYIPDNKMNKSFRIQIKR